MTMPTRGGGDVPAPAAVRTDWFVYALFLLFGCSSWIAINGIFAELPLFIDKLPEGWAINATLTLVIQGANAGPLLYFIVARYRRRPPLVFGTHCLVARK